MGDGGELCGGLWVDTRWRGVAEEKLEGRG